MKKIRQIGTIILTILVFMTFIVVPIQVSADGKEWDGKTITQPSKMTVVDGVYYYEISTPEELAYIAQTGSDWLGYNYILTNDIVLNDEELIYDTNGNLAVDVATLNQWTPINGFRGVFNGNDFSVSGVYVNTTSSAGFFVNCRGNVSNLTVTNSYIKGGSQVGGICGSFNETGKDMTNCYFDGAVLGTSSVGGLIGSNRTTNISNCGNYGDVWGTGDYVCGIVGSFYAYGIDNCFNEGNICSTGNYVAGIAGYSDIYDISGCINKGNITGNKYVAGICGCIEDAGIYNSGNLGTIFGKDYVGGVCGYSAYGYVESWKSIIKSSYNVGAVIGETYVGGITGYAHYADIFSSYNVGNVTGTVKTGAVIGYSESIWGKGEVKNCYYLKNESVNTLLNAFGNAEDIDDVANAESYSFFCINSDKTVNISGHTVKTIPGKSATCAETGLTEGKKCSVCDEVLVPQEEISATGHSYTSVVTAPTCTAKGFTTYTCSCGESYVDDYTDMISHTYESAVTAPTCTEKGFTTYTCVCGDTYNDNYVDATGHKEEILNAVIPTCTTTGLTEGKKCSVCGEILVAQSEIPALGHTEEVISGKSATCTETGLTEGKKCSVCGEILVAQEEIPALGHKEEVISGKSATCTETGLTEGKKCSVCGEILVAQSEIPATGHAYGEWTVVKNPTITEEGSEERTCASCGKVETRTIEKLSYLAGDINRDGKITAADARLALRIAAKLDNATEYQAIVADMNQDKKITAADARKILRISAKLE